MARYFGVGSKKDKIAYNLERCEEVVLLDAYLKVRERMQASDGTRNEFEYYFLEKGKGVSAECVNGLNIYLRRSGLPALEFAETTVHDYGRTSDQAWKANERQKIMASLETATPDARTKTVDYARAEMQALAPPHRTWVEYREDKEYREEETKLAREAACRENARRRLALPLPGPKAKPTLSVDMIATLLTATDDDNLRDEIIGRIAGSDLLVVLAKVADASTKNKLIRRALDG